MKTNLIDCKNSSEHSDSDSDNNNDNIYEAHVQFPSYVLDHTYSKLSETASADLELSEQLSTIDDENNSSLNNSLFNELQKTKRQLKNMEKRKNKFRDELRKIKKKNSKSVFKNEFKYNYKQILESNFAEDQIKVFEMQSRNKNFKNRMKWSVESIKKGLKLKFVCGSTGYDEVRKQIPLPTTRTLTGRIQNLKFKNGLLTEVFDFLAIKVGQMTKYDKECVVVIDEMYIEPGTQFDRSTNKIIGNVTFPVESKFPAKNGLVVMLAGVATRWKQTVAYEFTGNF